MNTATLTAPATVVDPLTAGPGAPNFKLTEGQEKALDAIYQFLLSPTEEVFVLEGYSGCGKSTLVRTLLDNLPAYMKTIKLIKPSYPEYEIALTATTNKAAENLGEITGTGAKTIHSFLGLRVHVDYKTNKTKLIPRNSDVLENYLLFVDEASYLDSDALSHIFKKMKNSKIIFVGDPAQLIPINATSAPVFDLKCSKASLTEVVRQAKDNPIIEMATVFRNTVNTGIWTPFKPDGHHIQVLSRQDFEQKILEEFTRPDWRYKDSKVLAWTNKCTIGYNNGIRNHTTGDTRFVVGDYAVCNSFLAAKGYSIKTDQLVHITKIEENEVCRDVPGSWITMDDAVRAFMPTTLQSRLDRIKQARAVDDLQTISLIDREWVDLRAAHSQTVNKSQGSTYGSVFIDLDDIGKCNNGNQIARMMYVGPSRARDHVYLTGDLV